MASDTFYIIPGTKFNLRNVTIFGPFPSLISLPGHFNFKKEFQVAVDGGSFLFSLGVYCHILSSDVLKELYTSISTLAQKLGLTLLNDEFVSKFRIRPPSD